MSLIPSEEWFGPPMGVEEVRRRSLRGVAVTFARRIVVRAINFGALFVLARWLTPGDFGLVAMTTAGIGIAGLLADFALSDVSIRVPALSQAQASNLFWIKLAGAALMFAAVIAAAPLVARFYGDARVATLAPVLGAGFLVTALGSQHLALLRRSLRFGELARIEIASALVTAVVSLCAAARGLGYWSLVAGSLAGGLSGLALQWQLCNWRPAVPSRAARVTEMVLLARRLTVYNTMAFVAGNLATLLIGKNWGASLTGHFGRASNLQSLMLAGVWEPLDQVAGPAMARLATDPPALASYYYRVAAISVIAGLPVAYLGIVQPHELVRVLLGPNWDEAAVILQILALGIIPSLLSHTTGWVYFSIGNPVTLTWWGLVGWGALIGGTLIGAAFGARGMAAGTSLALAALTWPCLVVAFRNTPVTVGAYCRAVLPPVGAAAVAALACALLLGSVAWTSALLKLALGFGLFLVLYAALLFTVFGQRRLLLSALSLLRPARAADATS